MLITAAQMQDDGFDSGNGRSLISEALRFLIIRKLLVISSKGTCSSKLAAIADAYLDKR